MKSYDIEDIKGRGKKPNQRMKHFLVLQYLMRKTDETIFASTDDIIAFLNYHNIYSERRSIYKDIEDINVAMMMLEEDCDYEMARSIIQGDEDAKTIRYKHKSGFYVNRRALDAIDVRLIAECIYSAKFITKSEGEYFIDGISSLLSERQKETLQHDVHVVGRVKTDNKEIINVIDEVDKAIKNNCKISFQYQTHVIQDMQNQVARRRGERYAVSPYVLLIDNGNYYMMAYDEKKQEIRTYRIDRMKNVKVLPEAREGNDEFEKVDIESYLQRAFSMYKGKDERVEIQFVNFLLDAVIDKFGRENAHYSRVDDKHFRVSTHVEVSDQFFAWVSGFRKRAVITAPPSVVKDYKKFLADIQSKYE